MRLVGVETSPAPNGTVETAHLAGRRAAATWAVRLPCELSGVRVRRALPPFPASPSVSRAVCSGHNQFGHEKTTR